jgi:EAL domain-containing protein (putative c-di-GMP-specific phosphodiesterase class I)/GGDEF domain-containing protein
MPNSAEYLTEVLPDLVVLVGRDGVLLEHISGRGLANLDPTTRSVGKRLDLMWPDQVAALVTQLTRRAIADRNTIDAQFRDGGVAYQVRVTALGPDRAICVIRPVSGAGEDAATASTSARQLDCRGFLRRFKDCLSSAALRETPTAVALIHVNGIADMSRVIDTRLAEQMFGEALLRLRKLEDNAAVGGAHWYTGPLGEDTLAMVIASADRDTIEACVARVCASLRGPINLGDATFHLTPYAGIAILGQDASSAMMLLDHARTAATEARRSGSTDVCFFADTHNLRSLARLDLARELREAIGNCDIRLRYVGRYDLATGRRVANVGYLRWNHPLRGEIRPGEFVRVAEATGLARALSRMVMQGLQRDLAEMNHGADVKLRISFGALRHHILHDDFIKDIAHLTSEGAVPAEQLELRISERSLIAADAAAFQSLKEMGIDLVVDEVGRGLSSLDQLARGGLSGMQLDRSWATAIRRDPIALMVSRTAVSMAVALGIRPIATGVDDAEQCRALLDLGYREGLGDLYREGAAGTFETQRTPVPPEGDSPLWKSVRLRRGAGAT